VNIRGEYLNKPAHLDISTYKSAGYISPICLHCKEFVPQNLSGVIVVNL